MLSPLLHPPPNPFVCLRPLLLSNASALLLSNDLALTFPHPPSCFHALSLLI